MFYLELYSFARGQIEHGMCRILPGAQTTFYGNSKTRNGRVFVEFGQKLKWCHSSNLLLLFSSLSFFFFFSSFSPSLSSCLLLIGCGDNLWCTFTRSFKGTRNYSVTCHFLIDVDFQLQFWNCFLELYIPVLRNSWG